MFIVRKEDRRIAICGQIEQAVARMRRAGIGAKVYRVADGVEMARCVSAQGNVRAELIEMGAASHALWVARCAAERAEEKGEVA